MELRKRIKDMINGSVFGGFASLIMAGAEANLEELVVLGFGGIFVTAGLTVYRLRKELPGAKGGKTADLPAKQLLRMMMQNGGRMTLTEAVMVSDQSPEKVEALMENLQQKGLLNVTVSEEGAVMFEIPRAGTSGTLAEAEGF